MRGASRVVRRVEIALWIVGVSLLGVALGATVNRWKYQAEQERAFIRVAAASQLAPRESALAPQRTAGLPPPADAAQAIPEEKAAREEAAPGIPRNPARVPLERQIALDSELLGRIEIPRLGVSAMVRNGDDEKTLGRAVGHVPGTAAPGEGGNTALAGHRDTFFRPLQRIKVDDRIRLVVPPHTYEYRVDSFRVVEPDELSVLESNGTEELTLVTCYPFRLVGPAPDRFIVKATRIP